MPRSILRALLFVGALAAASGFSRQAGAWTSAPVLNPGNGHYYAFFDASSATTWRNRPKMPFADALERASQMSHFGIPGHLVTITSQAEQDFIFESYKLFIGDPPWRSSSTPLGRRERFWIGASDAAIEGEWRWVAGPEAGQLFWHGNYLGTPLDYHNWHKKTLDPLAFSEPNNARYQSSTGEDFGSMFLGTNPNYFSSLWNDVSTIDDGSYVPRLGVVEFSPIPEPSTIFLISLASIPIAFARYSSRRLHRTHTLTAWPPQ